MGIEAYPSRLGGTERAGLFTQTCCPHSGTFLYIFPYGAGLGSCTTPLSTLLKKEFGKFVAGELAATVRPEALTRTPQCGDRTEFQVDPGGEYLIGT
jgi:hypothetical protein